MLNLVDRWPGLAAMIGAAIWLVAAFLGGQFAPGTDLVLGLSEQDYRFLLNPGLLLLLVGLLGTWRAQREGTRRSGSWALALVAAGLVAMLSGNLLEYGPIPSLALPGWGIFLVGMVALGPLGALLMTIAESARPTLRRTGRLGMLLLAIIPLVMFIDFGSSWVAFGVGWMLLGSSLLEKQNDLALSRRSFYPRP